MGARYSISSGMGACYYTTRGGGPGTTTAGFVNGSGVRGVRPERHAELERKLVAASKAGFQSSVTRHALARMIAPLLPLDRPTYESVRASLLHLTDDPVGKPVRWSSPDTRMFVWRLANPHRLGPDEVGAFEQQIRALAEIEAVPPIPGLPAGSPCAPRPERAPHAAQSPVSATLRGATFNRRAP